ncbi:MAG: ROK family protein, partial [Victivallales bacterium]|nr:ROK family protein [Victivallales bacterium]
AAIPDAKLKGIGVGLPANVEPETGIYNGASYYPNLKGVKVRESLAAKYHVHTIVDHDVILMTMAEYYLNKSNPAKDFGALFIGRSIGCRFIINGEVYRGVSNRASEFGHLSLQYDGPQCYCGNRGCFERLANTDAIEHAYDNGKTFMEIIDLARRHDPRAEDIFRREAEYIAMAVANIQNLMDVDAIVINGDIVLARDVLDAELHRQLQRRGFCNRNLDHDRVSFSKIGRQVGIAGPAIMAADRYFLANGINIFPHRKILPPSRAGHKTAAK